MISPKADACWLIDASVFFFKYYFAMPDHCFSEEGDPTAAVFGFSHWLLKLLKTEQPRYVVACFDESLGTCFRNDIYEDYKSSRAPADENIRFQFKACKQVCELSGIATYASNRYEADDLIGTIAQRVRKQGRSSVIVSRDKDLMQLLRYDDVFWHYPDGEQIDHHDVPSKFGVASEQIPDWLALVGDPIDDIPGVPGVGKKTAASLLADYPNLQLLFSALEKGLSNQNNKLKKLEGFETQIRTSYQLAKIVCDAPLSKRLRTRKIKTQATALVDFADTLGFSLRKPVQALVSDYGIRP